MMETGSSPFTPKDSNSLSPPEVGPLSRRIRSFCCSASSPTASSSSSSSSPSTTTTTTSSSFSSHNLSPLNPSSSIPFSWEHHPGIPKTPIHSKPHPDPLLPLPPPLRSHSDPFTSFPRKKRSDDRFLTDPFAVAMAECAKKNLTAEDGNELEEFWKKAKSPARRRRAAASISDRFGFFDLYGSCKSTCSVADATVYIPRSSRAGTYGLLNRRAG